MRFLRTTAVLAIALVALVVVGRRERSSEVAGEIAGMKRVVIAVGPLDQAALIGYRVQPGFDCLVYRRGSNAFALELCALRSGRLVEAIDRRGGHRRVYSLRSEPSASTVYVDRRTFDGLLDRMIPS
jgi:hypothetical protein